MSRTLLSDPPSTVEARSEADRLRRAYAEIAGLVGGLAHEIRNPLSTMTMNLDLLAEDLQGSEELRDRRMATKIERVRKESRRLQQILEDFLRFARAPEVRETIPADLNDIVEELRDFYEPQAVQQGVIMRTHLDPGLPPAVRLDADGFKQALLNLVLNAHQAMPDGGEMILTTRAEGDHVLLDLVDTGRGIPPEVLPRIFD